MPIETATDLAAMMDATAFADTVTLADGDTFLGYFHQGYSESLDIPGRRPALLCISADVVAVSVGSTLEVESLTFTVQHIEQGDRTTKLFLEKRSV